jgi:ATP-dependent RNA helicase RhlE
VPEDYIHRVGRTGRAEATGDAFTFVAPDEDGSLRDIERAVGRRLPRVTVPDFDYTARPKTKLEIPLAQRIAEIRARKREERARAELNAARRAAATRRPKAAGGAPRPPQQGGGRPQHPSGGRPAQPSGPRSAQSAGGRPPHHGSARPHRDASHAQHRPGRGPGRRRG